MARARARVPPALKHGAYSTATLLPGEDEDVFERLHKSLIAEMAPEGALEEHVVANLARFVWRRDNLAILRVAELAAKREWKLVHPPLRDSPFPAAEAQVRKELGSAWALVDMEATAAALTSEIEVRAQLDEMIDKCLKRLLFVRGLKSVGRTVPVARLAASGRHDLPDAETVHAAE